VRFTRRRSTAGAWFPSLDAEASSIFGVAGNLVTDADLGLDDPDAVLSGAVTFWLAQRHTLRIDGFGLNVDGSRQTDRSFTFDGRTYPISTSITSEADVVFVGVDYGYDLVHTAQASLGVTLGSGSCRQRPRSRRRPSTRKERGSSRPRYRPWA